MIFLKLENELLVNIELLSYVENESKDIEIKMIEKIIGLQKLKNLDFGKYKVNNNVISIIKGENTSLTNLIINWKNDKEKCILISLQKKFPNLSNIKIITPEKHEDSLVNFGYEGPIININENKNSKINNTIKSVIILSYKK